MATFQTRSNVITSARNAATKLIEAANELEACKSAWSRGISAQIVDATGTDPSAKGYSANDFRGHEGLIKADISQALGAALDALRTLLDSPNGRKIQDIAQ